LSALLHLGDAVFEPCYNGTDGCTLSKASRGSLGAAAALLGCDAAALAKAVTTRTRVTPDGPIVSPLGAKAAAETLDALSKVTRGAAGHSHGGGQGGGQGDGQGGGGALQ
jgi:myosin-5